MRRYRSYDAWLAELALGLHVVFGAPQATKPTPKQLEEAPELTEQEQQHSAGLMRVNHVGEICAQGLYQGASWVAKTPEVEASMREARREEEDHLAWCAERLDQLHASPSLLNPLWYSGALMLGVLAGAVDDKWSLGFVVETERQVEAHLTKHLDTLPASDTPSRSIVAQMRDDEAAHADHAEHQGAYVLPKPAQQLMRLAAKVMTTVAYRV